MSDMSILEKLKKDGLYLYNVKDQTPELCMAAVQQDGRALYYVEYQTHELCMAAVQQDGRALEYVKKQTPELCMAAVRQNGDARKYIKIQLSYYTKCSPSKDDICLICQDGESTDTEWCEVNNCKHQFHICCIESWLPKQKTCPKCRGCLI